MRIKITADKVQLFAYFIGIAFLGSLLLCLPVAYKPGINISYIDALFTSVSAVCVTGLSTISMDVYSTTGFVIIVSLIELGGLGLISFISFYLIAPKRKVSLVNRAIIRDFFIEDVEYDPKRILGTILVFTFTIEAISALMLYLPFKASGSSRPFIEALFHSVSAFCNAGFSTYNDSLISFRGNPVIISVVSLLIIVGGIGFIVIADVNSFLRRKRKRVSHHTIVVLLFTGFLIFAGAFAFFLLENKHSLHGLSLTQQLAVSLFQAITPRTAGFSVIDQSSLTPTTKLITMILMFIGGSPGSIAGGVKTTTFIVVVLYALRGNAKRRGMNVLNRSIDTEVIEKAFSIIAKSLFIITASITLLSITEKSLIVTGAYSIFDIMFESVSAFGTVGLSMGVTDKLSLSGKIIIILTMFIGRTGMVAMALGFIKSERERYFEYPSASILIG